MSHNVSPEIERIFSQLKWLEQRRYRMVEAVSAHFGRNLVNGLLDSKNLLHTPLRQEDSFARMLDEKNAEDFLRDFADSMQSLEALTVSALRSHVSVYQSHVDEQILFGARTAGQEAGRQFLSRTKSAIYSGTQFTIPEAVQAIFELTFNGLPDEKNHFLTIRPLGASSVHYVQSPHLDAWKKSGADPKFMYKIKTEWIHGILDILSPSTDFFSSLSIEQGNEYGLAHFYHKECHAGP